MINPEVDEEIIQNICDYVQENEIKEMLQEYLKRLVINKPHDPIDFLIRSIQENPYEKMKKSS